MFFYFLSFMTRPKLKRCSKVFFRSPPQTSEGPHEATSSPAAQLDSESAALVSESEAGLCQVEHDSESESGCSHSHGQPGRHHQAYHRQNFFRDRRSRLTRKGPSLRLSPSPSLGVWSRWKSESGRPVAAVPARVTVPATGRSLRSDT